MTFTGRTATEARSAGERDGGFTMVEIALCLAVIGFALVAIIGVLPLGMQVQRDSREETIINHDAGILLEAIRHGRSVEDLNIFVEEIALWSNVQPPVVYYEVQATNNPLIWGSNVVGCLSNPTSKRNEAIVRSMNGPAADTGSLGSEREMAFRYKVIAEVRPFTSFDPDLLSTNLLSRLQTNLLHEVRLTFRYPALPGGRTGTGKKVYRTVVSGQLHQMTNSVKPDDDELWFFKPQEFSANLP